MSQSLSTRISWSIALTLVRAATNFMTGLMLARFLGPEEFGRFSYLIATFIALRQLLDLAASNAFFTLLSEQPQSRRFLLGYWSFVAAQILISLLLLLVLIPQDLLERIWSGEPREILALAFLAVYSQYSVWAMVSQMGEASRKSKPVQIANTVIMAGHFLGVLFLYLFGWLALPALFLLMILEWTAGAVLTAIFYGYDTGPALKKPGGTRAVFHQYLTYCKPLALLTAFDFFLAFGDRWMLQTWSGSVDQAFLAIGLQIAAISLLAVTSILRIFWKEISEAHAAGRSDHVRIIYTRTSRAVFAAAAFGAALLMPWVQEIVTYVLGPRYQPGLMTITILLLMPVAQALGQVTGTMFLATKETRIAAGVGIAFAVFGIIGSYFVLAPASAAIPGAGLGSEGLALKLVVLGFLAVWVSLYWLKPRFGMPIAPIHQIIVIAGAVFVSFALRYALSPLGDLLGALLHFVLMLTLAVGSIITFPSLLFLERRHIDLAKARLGWPSRGTARPRRRTSLVVPFPPPVGGIASLSRWLHERLGERTDLHFVPLVAKEMGGLRRHIANFGRLLRAIRMTEPGGNVVFFSSAFRSFYEKVVWAVVVRLSGRTPKIIMVDGNFSAWWAGRPALLRRLVRAVVRRGRVVIVCQSRSWAEYYSSILDPCRIERIGATARDTFFKLGQDRAARGGAPIRLKIAEDPASPETAPPEPICLLYVGWLIPEKGIDDLFEAARLLHADGQDIRFDLVGPAFDQMNAWEHKREALGLTKQIRLHGKIEDARRLMEFYAAADGFVFPSHAEGFSVALVEAAASGLPIVATDVGGARETVDDGITGYLVPPRDPAKLAAAISRLAADASVREKMSQATVSHADRAFKEAAALATYQRVLECE